MYIRWKDKPRTKQNYVHDKFVRYGSTPRGTVHGRWEYHKEQEVHATLYCAYLVECKRVDGKPRQTSHYLGSIQDGQISDAWERDYFWRRVQKNLDALNLTEEQQSTLKAKIQERIPEVTEEQRQEREKQHQEKLRELHAKLRACM